MKLRDLKDQHRAELILFDVVSFSQNPHAKLITSIKEVKAASLSAQDNSYGYVGPHSLKYFKQHFKACKQYFNDERKTTV